ncbi:MAG: exopolysaccharide biosynthesis polyprenyl glycosylphosphotransferase [Oceanicaulis sp.]
MLATLIRPPPARLADQDLAMNHHRTPNLAAPHEQTRRIRSALSRRGSQAALLALCDLVAIAMAPFVAAPIAVAVKRWAEIPPYVIRPETFSAVWLAAVVGSVVLALWFRSRGHYRVTVPFSQEMRDVLAACMAALLITGFAFFALKDDVSRLLVGFTWTSALLLLIAGRQTVRAASRASGADQRACTLVASISREAGFQDWLTRHRELALHINRTIDFTTAEAVIEFGGDDVLLDLLLGHGDEQRELLICPSAADHAIALKLALRLTRIGVPYAILPDLGPVPAENVDIQTFAPDDMVAFVTRVNLHRPTALALKRTIDVVVSSIGLLALLPLLLPVTLLVKLDGGPLLFGQDRVGRYGRRFKCWKFRTMVVDAEARLAAMLAADPELRAQWEAYQKLDHDPRITPVGHLLRKSSLDELPQLLNVLRGEMSLVGPRPIMLDQIDVYGAALDAYVRMRPGLTGLWQVNGRNETTFAERARLDDWYARNWSLWRDFVILVKTVPEVFGRSGR